MSTQIPDEVWFQDVSYAITAVEGEGLFDPAEHGLTPGPLSTACWRGFSCWYRIQDGALTLDKVEMGRPEGRRPLDELFGVKAARGRHGSVLYRGMARHMPFTGRLLLGDDHVSTGYLNMGFLPAWLFDRVHEVVFDNGRFSAAYDRSEELAEVRRRLGAEGLRPGKHETTEQWIGRTFSLSFDYSWPSTW